MTARPTRPSRPSPRPGRRSSGCEWPIGLVLCRGLRRRASRMFDEYSAGVSLGTVCSGGAIHVDRERDAVPAEREKVSQDDLWILRQPLTAGELLAAIRPIAKAAPVVERDHRAGGQAIGEELQHGHGGFIEVAVDPRDGHLV